MSNVMVQFKCACHYLTKKAYWNRHSFFFFFFVLCQSILINDVIQRYIQQWKKRIDNKWPKLAISWSYRFSISFPLQHALYQRLCGDLFIRLNLCHAGQCTEWVSVSLRFHRRGSPGRYVWRRLALCDRLWDWAGHEEVQSPWRGQNHVLHHTPIELDRSGLLVRSPFCWCPDGVCLTVCW